MVDQLQAYESRGDPLYHTMRFVHGLTDDIKSAITVQRPTDLYTACVLAQLQEDVTPSSQSKRKHRAWESSSASKQPFRQALPLPSPPAKWDKGVTTPQSESKLSSVP